MQNIHFFSWQIKYLYMQRHEDADAVIKYRSDKFKRIYGNDYVNPFVNPRYKDLFRVFESIVEFVDVRVDKLESQIPTQKSSTLGLLNLFLL